jgi:toxin secretion/phage lysis holin
MSKIQFALVTIFTLIAQFFGGWDGMLQALVVMTILDYFTGVLSAGYHGKLSSQVGYRGIIKKVSIFVVVAVACVVSNAIDSDIVRSATLIFYISNEGISILENVGNCGVEYPDALKRLLEKLKDKKDGE